MINNAILGVIAGAGPYQTAAGDPFWGYVVSSAHFNALSGGGAPDAKAGGVWSLSAGQIDTTISRFGGGSLYLPTRAAYANYPNILGTGGVVGTKEFTIEFWMRPQSLSGASVIFDRRTVGVPNAPRPTIYLNGAQLVYFVNNSIQIAGGTAVLNTWQHVAVSRSAGQARMYLNGAQVGSTWADSTNYNQQGILFLGTSGESPGAAYGYEGHIDDFRFTIGVGRYAGSSFAVPTAQFPDF